MSDESEEYEPRLKIERFELGMTNYEVPMQIEIPDGDEVDPLMPLEEDPFGEEVKMESEIEEEESDGLPKIDQVISIWQSRNEPVIIASDFVEDAQSVSTIVAEVANPIVTDLLRNPYSAPCWTPEQRRTMLASRPRPPLGSNAFYERITWLCGCPEKMRYFCWPCLLFPKADLWSVPVDLLQGRFLQYCEEHNCSRAHQEATSRHLFEMSTARQLARVDILRNRKLLSLLIQSVAYLRKEKQNVLISEYEECFSYVAHSNKVLLHTLCELEGKSPSESTTNFVFKYSCLVESSIETFIKSTISTELKNARFVSLILEDFCSIVDQSMLAIIVHYVDEDGDVQQRTVRLCEIGRKRSSVMLFSLFGEVVSAYNLRLKVAGFTYSSTLVPPASIPGFNERVERLCPKAKCFHYQGHNMNGMVLGALSHFNTGCNFFENITEFQAFFKKNLVSNFYLREAESSSGKTQQEYDFDYGFITMMKRHSAIVCDILAKIEESPENWESCVSSQAPFFLRFLKSTRTRFWISLIAKIHAALEDLTKALQEKINPAEWKRLILQAFSKLAHLKKFGFGETYQPAPGDTLQQELLTAFNRAIESTLLFLRVRFPSSDFGYVDHESVATLYYARLRLTPAEIDKYCTQIRLLAAEPKLKDKPLPEAVKCFNEFNLSSVVPEYATFLDFAMSIPSSNTSMPPLAVERVQAYQRNNIALPAPKDLIWMEKELLADIVNRKKLIDGVIDVFTTNEGTNEFSLGKPQN